MQLIKIAMAILLIYILWKAFGAIVGLAALVLVGYIGYRLYNEHLA